jgi:hypothetical protein
VHFVALPTAASVLLFGLIARADPAAYSSNPPPWHDADVGLEKRDVRTGRRSDFVGEVVAPPFVSPERY